MTSSPTNGPLATIPPPPQVRERIGRLTHELSLLRKLLRLSESVHKDRLRVWSPDEKGGST
jgi:hypothetical protein